MVTTIRHVKVTQKSSKRGVSIEVFAQKDPIRAAKRFAKKLVFDSADYDWSNAQVIEGPAPNSGRELEIFEEEILRGMLTGEIQTS